ncbi:MAG: yeaH [Enterovirga sp.]|nr:yeaH [Enterovirga sp.]
MHIIDRRLNPGGKNFANRQRFLRRAKAAVRQAVRESSEQRGIKELDQGGEISIPRDSIREPRFGRASSGGQRQAVLPGNKKFVPGDTLPKDGGGGGGSGSEGSPDGGGQDAFSFVLSQEEYLDLFFEDLELPNMAKRALAVADSVSLQRAGYSVSGSPANLAVARTMRNSLSRRLALRRPKAEEVERLKQEIEALEAEEDEPALDQAKAALAALLTRTRRIPYVDPMDLRFRRFEAVPKPVSQAVMFCLMDTSASMTEHMKDLAKRFFALLYLFLKRRYQHVEVVFIRHTHLAEEVDEDTFFHARETGGTVVSSALEAMHRIAAERYRLEDWNIYGAQASDGDNAPSDAEQTLSLLRGAVLPLCQYFAYLEVGRDEESTIGFMPHSTELWRTYEKAGAGGERFAMCKVGKRTDIYPVFRKLFERRTEGAAAP